MAANETDFTVAQMSAVTGVSAHTLRYYERAGLLRPVARNVAGHRRYSAADVEWVSFLLRLRETGMPIARMRAYATLREGGPATARARMHLLDAHRESLSEQIVRMRSHEEALLKKIATYRDAIGVSRADAPHGAHHEQGVQDD